MAYLKFSFFLSVVIDSSQALEMAPSLRVKSQILVSFLPYIFGIRLDIGFDLPISGRIPDIE
jgi:hypothetical protein